MGKKDRNQEPSLNNVANRDIIQRINFLYQASTYLNTVAQPTPLNHGQAHHKGKEKKRNAIRHPQNTSELSRSYVSTMRIVGQKAMVRMDPSIKRTLCKKCDTILIPGSTSSVRVKTLRVHEKVITYTCHTCGTVRRIPAAPVLDLDAQLPEETTPSNDTGTANSSSLTAAGPSAVAGGNETSVMDVYSTIPRSSAAQAHRVRKPRQLVPRMPPLFERKGHVIFRGNELLTQ